MSVMKRGMIKKKDCENTVKQSLQKLNFHRNERWDGCQKNNTGAQSRWQIRTTKGSWN